MLISIAAVLIFGITLGKISEKFKIPGLFGMIIGGILIGPYVLNILSDDMLRISPDIRKIALIVILTRAGISLDVEDLKKSGIASLFLCFLPATFEIAGCVLLAPYLLKISVLDAAIMGCVLAAVSPAVVVPRMINLIDKRYGTKRGIPQMILTGASVDDIYVIVLFTAFIALRTGGDFTIKSLFIIPISIILGIGVGTITGIVYRKVISYIRLSNIEELVLVLSISLILVYFEGLLSGKFDFASLISVMVFANVIVNKDEERKLSLSVKYSHLWSIAQIFLFVLVGAVVDITTLKYAGLSSIALIMLALLVRFVGVFVSLLPKKMPFKERIFVMIAYSPKATVQAAIGGVALEKGIESGNIILTVAVISILITAPLGAFLIDNSYRKLLSIEDEL